MSQSLTHRRSIIAVIVLSLALAAMPWTASAAPNRPAREGADVFTALKGWLTHLWAANGCVIIPDGRCLSEVPQRTGGTTGATHQNGCIIDPNGRCLQGPTTDNGCIIDPSGRCKVGQ